MFKIFDKLGGEEKCLDLIEQVGGRRPTKVMRADWRRWRVLQDGRWGYRIPAIRAVILLDECTRRRIRATYHEDCMVAVEEASDYEAAE
jgi:hypothetical protein